MKKKYRKYVFSAGFSLAELLLALTIGTMVLIAVLAIYSRAQNSASAIAYQLQSSRLPQELLQRIAEDLDGIITSGPETKIIIENKFDEGFATAMLTVRKTYYGHKNRQETFEEITWQSDYEPAAESLVLYRSRIAVAPEDRLLDSKKEDWERQLYVPLCGGITFFKIQAVKGQSYHVKWLPAQSLPDGITVTVSFAQPFKTVDGTLDVPESQKITRTIAVDRTRKLKFIIKPKQQQKT